MKLPLGAAIFTRRFIRVSIVAIGCRYFMTADSACNNRPMAKGKLPSQYRIDLRSSDRGDSQIVSRLVHELERIRIQLLEPVKYNLLLAAD